MSLIERLRDWGESLFTSKKAFVAHQALPQGNIERVTVQLQNVDGWTYTPPEDGYLAADIYSADQVFLHSGVLSYLDAGDRKGIYLPVRKGENVSVGSANHSSSSSLYFFPLIGGGYLSSILQAIGGGLCLISHSFNRFSSSAVAKRIRQAKESQSTCRQAVLLHHTMGISSSEQTLLMGKTLLSMLGGLFLCRLTVQKFVTHVLQYLVQKDKLFISAQVVLSTLRHSFRQKARLSFCEGGAL